MSLSDNRSDSMAGLSDEEFACLIFRSCGDALGTTYNLDGIFRSGNHKLTCGFCTGEKQVAK